MIVDTSALLAYFDAAEPKHAEVTCVIDGTTGLLVVSPYIVAELDYLVLTRHGSEAELAVLQELCSGAWELAHMDTDQVTAARRIVEQFRDQPISVADASNIVLAHTYHTQTVATLDRRHFGVLRLEDGTAPIIVP